MVTDTRIFRSVGNAFLNEAASVFQTMSAKLQSTTSQVDVISFTVKHSLNASGEVDW